MALRARLVAPPPLPKTVWPWHTVKLGNIPVSAMFIGDRRMEAETYLSSGYGIRTAIQSRSRGWKPFGELARAWMPGRLKGIQVSREYGTPFLAATQVFDVRPVPRKWLSLDRTDDSANRFVRQGMILVTCSGSVGRPTIAYAPHEQILISHDLLRVEAIDRRDRGWIYAYLHSRQTRAMAIGAHYGHIIKHLETSHIEALPIPTVDDDTAADFARRVERILALRNEGHRLTLEAESRFEKAIGPISIKDWGDKGFTVHALQAFAFGRRRMDATIHNPGVSAIRDHLARHGKGFTSVAAAGYQIWLPTRFRRVPAADGVPLVESASLTEINPDITKRIADNDFGDPHQGRVKSGWVLMARSGQAYGIIGTAVLAEHDLEDKVVSDDVMRIKPGAGVALRPGYLVTALSHPVLGRPLVKSLTYGSSIPHMDVSDIAAHEVVRLEDAEESAIAELAEASAKARAAADLLEREMATDAAAIIDRFISQNDA
jgi:hypothetical protein